MKTKEFKTPMREGFEQQRKAGMNVDWFTWQIAWHDALFTQHDIAGGAAQPGERAAFEPPIRLPGEKFGEWVKRAYENDARATAPQATVKGDAAATFESWAAQRFPVKCLSTKSDSREMDEAREFAREGWEARAAVPQAPTLTDEQREAIVTALRHLPASEVDARYALTWLLAKGY